MSDARRADYRRASPKEEREGKRKMGGLGEEDVRGKTRGRRAPLGQSLED